MLASLAHRSRALRLAKLLGPVLAAGMGAAGPAGAEAPAASGALMEATSQSAPWALPPTNLSRRSAVLGTPSRAEQILAAQGSAAAMLPVMPAMARADRPSPGGGPDIFGSVALAVAATPLDGKWRRSMVASGGRQLAQWTGALSPADGRDPMRVLGEVNRWVNARVRFVDDLQAVGQADQWAGAAETLRRAQGDCEDFALAKLQLLAALGFDADRLYLVIARDLVRRADHAVLVVRLDDRFVVLDNMTDEILDSNEVGDYRPVMSYSASGRWIHGYERPADAPIQLASSVAP